MAKAPQRPEVAPMVDERARGGDRSAARRRGTRADALEIIFATAVEEKEGFRTGALGAPRFGKTYHLKEVADEAVARGLCELELIHDCKRLDVQYEGVVRADVTDLAAHPLAPDDTPVIVFHGNPAINVKASVEDVAELGLRLGRGGTSCLVLVDELYHGLKGGQTWSGPSFAEIMREGSSQRVSSAWTTQIPQALPREPMDCSETIAIFHLAGRSLSYAVDKLGLPPEAAPVIKNLQRGEFVLWTAFEDWDGVIYGPT